MRTHVSEPPLAYDTQVRVIDTIEGVLWAHYEGHLGHIQTIATIDAIIKEHRQ